MKPKDIFEKTKNYIQSEETQNRIKKVKEKSVELYQKSFEKKDFISIEVVNPEMDRQACADFLKAQILSSQFQDDVVVLDPPQPKIKPKETKESDKEEDEKEK